jgi:hypothetical protein
MSDDIHFQITEDADSMTVLYRGVTFTWFTRLDTDEVPNYIWSEDWQNALGFAKWEPSEMPTPEKMRRYVTYMTAQQMGGEL